MLCSNAVSLVAFEGGEEDPRASVLPQETPLTMAGEPFPDVPEQLERYYSGDTKPLFDDIASRTAQLRNDGFAAPMG